MKFSNEKGDLILINREKKCYDFTIVKYIPNTAEIEQIVSIKLNRDELFSFCLELSDVN